jgi:phosphopantothenoylcysteine decarboxylase/phosphopantothenate--cysteine ligase
MHTEMWQNPATVANIATLRARGVTIVGPAIGQLTGSDTGAGRMVDPDDVVSAALAALTVQDLAGRRVLVTAGGTREALDPVRFIGNRSSGRQGVALAVAAASRGAEVTLLAANLEVPVPTGITRIDVVSAGDLASAAALEVNRADIVIMAAAVADYRPAVIAEAKIKKESAGERLTLELVRNPDILSSLSASKRADQIVVGFAAETEPDDAALLEAGRGKVARKGCDYLVLNRVGWAEGFSVPDNDVVMLDLAGDIVMRASGSKASVAHRILDRLA